MKQKDQDHDVTRRLRADPFVYGGRVCTKGTRIPASLILDTLAGGGTVEDLLRGYPFLTREDIGAALGYGAHLAEKGILPLAYSSWR